MVYHKTNTVQSKAGSATRINPLHLPWAMHPGISASSPAPPIVSHERAESQGFATTVSPTQSLETLQSFREASDPSPMTDELFLSLPASIDDVNQPLPDNNAAGIEPKLGLSTTVTGEVDLNRPSIPSQNSHIDHSSNHSENDLEHQTFESMVQESAESLPFYGDELFGSDDPSTWGAEDHDTLDMSTIHSTPDNPAGYELAHGSHHSSLAMTPVTMTPGIQGEMDSSVVSSQADAFPSTALAQTDSPKQHIENQLEMQLEENRGGKGENGSTVNQSHTSPNVGDAVSESVTSEGNKLMVSNPFSSHSDESASDVGASGTSIVHNDNDLKALSAISGNTDDGFADRPELYQNLVSESLEATDEDSTSTHFTSLEEARESLKIKSRTPAYDSTVPRSVAQKRAFVKRLIELFWSLDNAMDNDGQKKPFKTNGPDPRSVELACWEVLEAAITRETRGAFTGKSQKGNIGSFASRMAAIMEAIDLHKTICKHLLRVHFLHQFIDDPIGSRHRVISNQRLNKDKANLMKLGKQFQDQDTTKPKARSKAISPNQKSIQSRNALISQNSGLPPQFAANANRPLAPAPAPRASPLEHAVNTAHFMGNNPNVPRYPAQYTHQQMQSFRGGQYQVAGTPSLASQSLNNAMYSRTQPVSNDFEPNMLPAYSNFPNSQASQMLGVNHNSIQQWPQLQLQGNQYGKLATPAAPSQVSHQGSNPPPVTRKRGHQDNHAESVSAPSKRRR